MGPRIIVNAHVGILSIASDLVPSSTILAIPKGVVLLSTLMKDYCQQVYWIKMMVCIEFKKAGNSFKGWVISSGVGYQLKLFPNCLKASPL